MWRLALMNRRLFLIAGLSLAAAGCAATPPPIVAPASFSLGELEPLYAARAERDAIHIRVASNGCTRKEDFAFFIEPKGDATTVAFGRKRLDTCQSFVMGQTELSFTYEELGVAKRTPLFVLNPFYSWTGPVPLTP